MSTFVCVASGPSLTREDVEYCRDKATVIVVNDGFRLAPWADVLYAADHRWWICRSLGEGMPNHELSRRIFAGERVTCDPGTAQQFGLTYVPHRAGPGIDPPYVRGSHSGHEAVCYAVNKGAKRIILLGYDMGATGTRHWFGDHPDTIAIGDTVEPMNTTTAAQFDEWCREFEVTANQLESRGIEVLNCTRRTALTCFPLAALEDVLCSN